ncbi:MAG: histidine kinase [Dinghuibacter sp.]|nr:histidine kinase [Dinghuibacter sp.]
MMNTTGRPNKMPVCLFTSMMLFRNKYGLLFVTGLSVFTFINTEFCRLYEHFNIPVQWYYALAVIFLCTLATWEINRWLQPYFVKDGGTAFEADERRKLAYYFFSATTCSILATGAVVSFFHYVVIGLPEKTITNPLKLSIIYIVLAGLLFHLLHAVVLYQARFRNKLLETEQLKRENIQAELLAVKSQMNPHFLFNNLNVLSALVMKENSDANKFIEAFSTVYHYILHTGEKEMVPLEKELEFLQPYTFILNKRFGDSLQLHFNIEPGAMNHHILPVALQALIENAIKHNVVSRSQPLHIELYNDGEKALVLRNNLQPRINQQPSTQTGLNSLDKRYKLLTGRNIRIQRSDTHFTVTLPLIKIHSYASAYS